MEGNTINAPSNSGPPEPPDGDNNNTVQDDLNVSGDRCALCLEEKRAPKRVPCGHTFCQECLNDYKAYRKYPWARRCPLCRGYLREKRRGDKRSSTTEHTPPPTSRRALDDMPSTSGLSRTRFTTSAGSSPPININFDLQSSNAASTGTTPRHSYISEVNLEIPIVDLTQDEVSIPIVDINNNQINVIINGAEVVNRDSAGDATGESNDSNNNNVNNSDGSNNVIIIDGEIGLTQEIVVEYQNTNGNDGNETTITTSRDLEDDNFLMFYGGENNTIYLSNNSTNPLEPTCYVMNNYNEEEGAATHLLELGSLVEIPIASNNSPTATSTEGHSRDPLDPEVIESTSAATTVEPSEANNACNNNDSSSRDLESIESAPSGPGANNATNATNDSNRTRHIMIMIHLSNNLSSALDHYYDSPSDEETDEDNDNSAQTVNEVTTSTIGEADTTATTTEGSEAVDNSDVIVITGNESTSDEDNVVIVDINNDNSSN